MNVLMSLLLLPLVKAQSMHQVEFSEKYPACLGNEDCFDVHRLQNHACFSYMCYPIEKQEVGPEDDPLPFKQCRNSRECPAYETPEGQKKQTCNKNYDRRNVPLGICVDDTFDCVEHADCEGNGGKCCNGVCCSESYFGAIGKLPCVTDMGCKVRCVLSYMRIGRRSCIRPGSFYKGQITA